MAAVGYLVAFYLLFIHAHTLGDPANGTIANDFVSFALASQQAVQGNAEVPYQFDLFSRLQAATSNGEPPFAFFYPPTYLLLLFPLGYLTGFMAFATFQLVSMIAASAMAWRIAGTWRGAFLFLLIPTSIASIFHGQNGFLTSALLGGALWALSENKGVLAGILIGVLTVKPQLGLLIPFALIAGGYWRTFLTASLTTLVFAAASWLVFGTDVWLAFFDQGEFAREAMSDGLVAFHKLVSVFAGARLIGASIPLAFALQGAISTAVLLVVLWAWRSPARFSSKALVLIGGGLLATPFLLSYDLALIGVGVVYLYAQKIRGELLPWDLSLGVLAVLIAGASRYVAGQMGVPIGPLAPAIIMAIGMRQIYSQTRTQAV